MQIIQDHCIFSTEEVIALNKVAVETGRNRALHEDVVESLDPNGEHVEWIRIAHNDCEYRLGLLLKLKGSVEPYEGWIDVPFELIG